MKVFSDKSVHFEHLIYQPTISCLGKCKNCYIQRDFSNKTKILSLQKIRYDQFTISIDKEPSFQNITNIDCRRHTWQDKNLCFTIKNPESGARLIRWLGISILKGVQSISISDPGKLFILSELKKILSQHKVELVYNLLCDHTSPTEREQELIDAADIVYLTLLKGPLGKESPLGQQAMDNYFSMKESIPEDKLIEDKCVIECKGIVKNKQSACHAGIHVATIWPDLSCTGCPYDSLGVHGIDTGDVYQNLKQVEKIRPIQSCKVLELVKENINDV